MRSRFRPRRPPEDRARRARRAWRLACAGAGLVAAAVAVAVVVPAASRPVPTDTVDRARPARHTGPQGRVGQFVVKCRYDHSAADDPIVHSGRPGRSHRHDFYGAVGTGAHAAADVLVTRPTTCDKPADTAAYWHPTLYDGGAPIEPRWLTAYYRAAPGVAPAAVEPFPFGLALIAGDAAATAPEPGGAAGWTCGASTRLAAEPPPCSPRAPLHLVLTFPDCWDGRRLVSDDHVSHAAYSSAGRCPPAHPVHIPQLTVAVTFPLQGRDHDLRLASGPVWSAHGDFLNAWDPSGLRREVEACIQRSVVCDVASNRAEEGPFFHD
jgi:hypothetical protein